jgi:hypothetical protein
VEPTAKQPYLGLTEMYLSTLLADVILMVEQQIFIAKNRMSNSPSDILTTENNCFFFNGDLNI